VFAGVRLLYKFLAGILVLLISVESFSAPTDIGINQVRNRSTYMLDLMKLALSYSENQYRFVEMNERFSKNAEREAALNGKIGVFWGGTSDDQERDFIPVLIDGYRGLMSMRFFIIRENDQARFDKVRTLADLQQIPVGQGRSWRDGKILEAAGITVERSSKKTGLYYMLEGGRFDGFPRGATEAWVEAEANKHLNLTVEKSLIVKYPLPTYFFVNKGFKRLADDIESGLTLAIEDGAFDRFFYQNDRVQAFLRNANLQERRVIELSNPFLPKSASGKGVLKVEELIEGSRRLKNGEFAAGI